MENTPTVDEVVVPKKNILFEVTTVSKALAAVLFIILPFVGFWIGYTYNNTGVTENNVPPTEKSAVTNTETATIPAKLVRLEKDSIKSTEVSVKPLGEYIQKMELDPAIVKDVRAKENQDKISAGEWYEVANGYISGETLNGALEIDPIKLGAESMEYLGTFGPGYFQVVKREPLQALTLRHIYGDGSYAVHSTLDGFMGANDIKDFSTLYSSDGVDFSLINGNQTLIREGESWVSVPTLNDKDIKFITPELNERMYDVFYFTDGKDLYGMYGNRPYEGCCTIMTENMFTVVGADLASFEIIDKATARDKNNVYTSTMSEKGRVELSISAR